jgi:putative endonuclease
MILQRPNVSTRKTGNAVEDYVGTYLQTQGLHILERNFQTKFGEIDLIARDNDSIVFVEVRYREKQHYGSGSETVTFYKQQRIIKTAFSYLKQKHLMEKVSCRFDVVAASGQVNQPIIEWIKDAFQASGY